MHWDNLTIIIPSLNEEGSIGRLLDNLQSLYPDVTFLILDWNGGKYNEERIDNVIDLGEISNVYVNLQKRKLCLYQTEKALNGDYEYAYKDEHPNSEGHRWVASKIIQYIKNLENTKI